MSDRHYEKREYAGNYAAFGTGFVFLFVGIMSLVMRAFNFDLIGLSGWGFWLFIPAFFILLGAVSQLYTDKKVRQDVQIVLQDRGNGRFKLDEIAAEAGVKRKFLLRVLMDLRAAGRVKYKYDGQTGEIIIGEEVKYEQAPEYQPMAKGGQAVQAVPKEKKFCIFCGQQLEQNPGVKFCPNCGSQLP
nr:zinc ribbon domain-containing protein [Candidatus Sigynarchaeota archaeon]